MPTFPLRSSLVITNQSSVSVSLFLLLLFVFIYSFALFPGRFSFSFFFFKLFYSFSSSFLLGWDHPKFLHPNSKKSHHVHLFSFPICSLLFTLLKATALRALLHLQLLPGFGNCSLRLPLRLKGNCDCLLLLALSCFNILFWLPLTLSIFFKTVSLLNSSQSLKWASPSYWTPDWKGTFLPKKKKIEPTGRQ